VSETVTEPEQDPDEDADGALDEDFVLSPGFIQKVLAALDEGRADDVKDLIKPLHAADVADLIGLVSPRERRELIDMMGESLDPQVLSELEPDVRSQVLGYLDPAVLAQAIETLDSDDAVFVLEDLSEDQQREILSQLPEADRTAVEMGLQYPEETAGRLMQRDFVAIPPYWTVGEAIDFMRESDDLPDEFFELYVVDPSYHPMGAVHLSRVLRTKRVVRIEDLMEEDLTIIPADMEQEEVAYAFEQYDLVSAPVVDDGGRLVGMITIDDILDVIQEEAEEDILALAGVGDEGLSDTVITTTSRRFSWLFVNLLTAIFASLVIAVFQTAIEQIVALAVLMPIVASMGGNAGTQTLTVAVRSLATKDLTPTNAGRIIWREALVGGLNGILFALVMAIICYFWFKDAYLALVIGLAMIVNLLAAGLAGILIPIGLQRAGADPAIASSVFVTTVTDVMGFFVFLGLATWLLLG
jgi:magnesium transporter